MAKDDYHVIVYQILGYLYSCLKQGIDPDSNKLANRGPMLDINERYWCYVWESLVDYGFVKGVSIIDMDNTYSRIANLERAQITPRGIEYLTENSFMQKVKRFLKDAKDVTPFV